MSIYDTIFSGSGSDGFSSIMSGNSSIIVIVVVIVLAVTLVNKIKMGATFAFGYTELKSLAIVSVIGVGFLVGSYLLAAIFAAGITFFYIIWEIKSQPSISPRDPIGERIISMFHRKKTEKKESKTGKKEVVLEKKKFHDMHLFMVDILNEGKVIREFNMYMNILTRVKGYLAQVNYHGHQEPILMALAALLKGMHKMYSSDTYIDRRVAKILNKEIKLTANESKLTLKEEHAEQEEILADEEETARIKKLSGTLPVNLRGLAQNTIRLDMQSMRDDKIEEKYEVEKQEFDNAELRVEKMEKALTEKIKAQVVKEFKLIEIMNQGIQGSKEIKGHINTQLLEQIQHNFSPLKLSGLWREFEVLRQQEVTFFRELLNEERVQLQDELRIDRIDMMREQVEEQAAGAGRKITQFEEQVSTLLNDHKEGKLDKLAFKDEIKDMHMSAKFKQMGQKKQAIFREFLQELSQLLGETRAA